MASHPDPTQPVRLFLQYTDIVLSLIGTCLAVVVLNATMHSFPGVVHFGPILLLHILLRGFGWTQMATFTSFSAVLILQIYHVYNVHPANAVIQSNATPWEKVWLSFGWFAIGFHIGLQPVRLRTRVAMAAVSNALRILRLLRIFWLTREQGVLLMVVTNSFLCLLDAALANACIPQGQLALHSFLGKGAFGDVYEGSWAQPEAQAKAQPTPAAAASSQGADGHAQGVEAAASQHEVTRTTPTTVVTRRVAVKLIHRHRIEAEQLSVFKRAASLELQLAAHPNIVRLFGWSMVPETAQLMLAMEFCGGRSLGDSIDSGATRKWGERRTLTVALDVARGIAFLHAQDPPVLHRDLKPANIIFDEARGAKLADFGASRVAAVDGNWMTSWGVGTPLFAAPEQLTYQIYDRSVDLWAYGCVLACLANHEGTPFGPRLQVTDRMLARVASGSLVPEAAADHVLHTLVRDCCQPSTLRPAAAHVVERLTLQLDELPTIVADIGGGCVSGSPTSEPAAC